MARGFHEEQAVTLQMLHRELWANLFRSRPGNVDRGRGVELTRI